MNDKAKTIIFIAVILITVLSVCGDYAVFNMPFGEDYFRLIYSENLAEYTPTD